MITVAYLPSNSRLDCRAAVVDARDGVGEKDASRGVAWNEEREAAVATRKRRASRRLYPSWKPRKTPPRATWSHAGANPSILPCRRPPLALAGQPRIVLLRRRGAASLAGNVTRHRRPYPFLPACHAEFSPRRAKKRSAPLSRKRRLPVPRTRPREHGRRSQ